MIEHVLGSLVGGGLALGGFMVIMKVSARIERRRAQRRWLASAAAFRAVHKSDSEAP